MLDAAGWLPKWTTPEKYIAARVKKNFVSPQQKKNSHI